MKCANFSCARVRFIKYVHLFPKKTTFYVFFRFNYSIQTKLYLYQLHICVVVLGIIRYFLANKCW